MRFTRIQMNDKDLLNGIIDKMKEQNYKQIPDSTGGDHDFITIDSLRKEWIWCENGFNPFCSEYDLSKYQFQENITLKKMDNNRW